ncbi:MAG: acetyl-CoA carboxylase biotin carboxyl carrier protein subunit, partial [Thermomicrobiales bacterium]|nr:acetyl-CoA carboxylase biotin carboxyl carrier protein subunit [Thermomicrobiales bacterium]
PGDAVEAGQSLVTLTAMKMELACTAPTAGIVQAIRCSVDQQVEAGAILATLEPAASA